MTPIDLAATWQATWPQSLAAWSPYTLLRPPLFLEEKQAAERGMGGQIAAIRLTDQTVIVNTTTLRKLHLDDHALAVLAHEIGHHVYVPGNLADNARMIAAIKPVLFGLPTDTPAFVANLYGDLLINDRLQRRAGVDVAAVYQQLQQEHAGEEVSQTWRVYTRAYEHLWRLPAGTLGPADVTPEIDGDALLIARLVRHYAGRWLAGARRFAAILYPYLLDDQEKSRRQTFLVRGLGDCRCPCAGGVPDGIVAIDPAELGDDDSFDRELEGLGGRNRRGRSRRKDVPDPKNTAPEEGGPHRSQGQFREPFEYGELLKALGLDLSRHEITTRYYRERALPHLIPFPSRRSARAQEPLAEGYETWDASEDIDQLDLFGSLVRSPVLVPGVTTVQRVYGQVPGAEPAKTPLDLDIYVDCSGSMPDPAGHVSYLALAGTILALSALRAGARVQATLWSGAGQFDTTGGFLRDEKRILGVITGYISGSTAFPLHVLRDTYAGRKPSDPPAHIVVISDDGVDTILETDERGTPGETICKLALEKALGGGTLVLNLPDADAWGPRGRLEGLGFHVHAVTDWEQLIAFARAFVRENYAQN